MLIRSALTQPIGLLHDDCCLRCSALADLNLVVVIIYVSSIIME